MTQCAHAGPGAAAVAIIVPAYNAMRTLPATLESALAQTGVAREIIVVDDGSADDTLAVARRYEPQITVLAGPNRGVSAARNSGIAASSAPWLVFLDADDTLAQGTLAQRIEVAQAHRADVVITDWQDVLDDGAERLAPGPRRSVDWAALARNAEIATATHVWATTAAILYARPLVERIGGFRRDLPVIQDARLLFDAAHHGASFVHSPHVGARYRIVGGSLSRRDPAQFWLDVLRNGEQIVAIWQSANRLSAAYAEAARGIFNNAARGLFAAGHPAYFDAVAALRRFRLDEPLHSRIAEPIARHIGLAATRRLAALVGRA